MVMRVTHTDFRELCREHGLAATHQREIIYRAVVERPGHLSPEEIYENVRRQIPSISLATVYKNIKTFVTAGLLLQVSPHHSSLRIESNHAPHHHLFCTRCNTILDIEAGALGSLQVPRKLPDGFRMQSVSIEIHGLCGKCAAKSKQI